MRNQCNCIDDINTLYTDSKICDLLIEKEHACQKHIYKLYEAGELDCGCLQKCNETCKFFIT